MEKELPKTENYLNHMEEIRLELSDDERYEHSTDEERAIYNNSMLHLAETIFMERPDLAEELTKYLCILCDINIYPYHY